MFICKKELLDSYCEWLFSVLFKFEEKINYNELKGNEKRVFGLWGEYLLNVYIIANKLNVIKAKCINTSTPFTPFTLLKDKIAKMF